MAVDNSVQGGNDTIRDLARGGGAPKTQVFQLDLGGVGANAENLITAGSQLKANSLPTVLASDTDLVASGTLAVLNATVVLPLNGVSSSSVTLAGTWVGTVSFDASGDGGATFNPVNAVAATTSQPQPTTTANGLYRLTPGALSHLRVNMSAYVSGTVSVTIRASVGSGGIYANQILPTKNTNGTDTQAIKPASTAATAADAAAVVTISPNTGFGVQLARDSMAVTLAVDQVTYADRYLEFSTIALYETESRAMCNRGSEKSAVIDRRGGTGRGSSR